jgi:TonB family protein
MFAYRARVMAVLALGLGCGHDRAPIAIEAPNWFSWGRRTGGAPVSYPAAAWDAGIEGSVAMEVCIGETGRTLALRQVSGPAELGEAVRAALATWSFEPVVQDGRPVRACFQRRFTFRKNADLEDFFRTEGEMIVTRNYHPAMPAYRPPLQLIRADGPVYVRVCPGKDGVPADITVLQGLGTNVNAQVAQALVDWRYRPARLRGKAVPSCRIERFTLFRDRPPVQGAEPAE